MKRKFFQTPLLTLIAIFIICFSSIFIINACRKFDRTLKKEVNPEEKFFAISSSTPSPIRKIHDFVTKQNDKKHFVSKVVKNFGYPLWNKALFVDRSLGRTSADLSDLVYIPFAKDSYDCITSVLIAYIDGHDSLFYLLGANHYEEYGFDFRDTTKWNAKDVFNLFALFEQRVFKHNKLRILDPRLFPLEQGSPHIADLSHGGSLFVTKHESSSDNIDGARFGMFEMDCVTYDICWDDDGGSDCCGAYGDCDPTCGCWDHDETICSWYESSGGGDGGPLSGGLGSGGDGWSDTDPCKAIPDPQGSDPNGTGCLTNLPIGWNPVPDGGGFDPYQADSIRINNDVRDSFPCVYRLLHDTLTNVNQAAQLELFSNFGVSQYDHLTFAIGWNLTSDSANAYTTPGHIYLGTDDNVHFTDTIYLNPYFFRHGSKEFVISSILHEAIHAYINYCLRQYFIGNIDSGYLKLHFPLHWEWLTHQIMTPDNQHISMAQNYIDFLQQHTAEHGNMAVSDSLRQYVAKNLAWGGLYKTSAWLSGLAGDTCTIRYVNGWAEKFDVAISSMSYPGCALSHNWFRDSLHMKNPCD